MSRYYLTMRPPAPGTFPRGATGCEDFGGKVDTGHGFKAWGWVEYERPLTPEQVDAYELREA